MLEGIRAADAAGFRPLKIDTVVMRGVNDDELADLIEFARPFGAEVRFIEYMDVGGATHWSTDQVLSREAILADLTRRYGPIEPLREESSAPADRYRLPDGTAVRHHRLDDRRRSAARCDRARLTADGMWYLCLYARLGIDLRAALRGGASRDELVGAHRRAAGAGATTAAPSDRLAERDRAAAGAAPPSCGATRTSRCTPAADDARARDAECGRPDVLRAASLRCGLATLACVLAACAFAEAVLRLVDAVPEVANPLYSFHESDPVLGWRGKPERAPALPPAGFDVVIAHDAQTAGACPIRRRRRDPRGASWCSATRSPGAGASAGRGVHRSPAARPARRRRSPTAASTASAPRRSTCSCSSELAARALRRRWWCMFFLNDVADNVDGKSGRRPLFELDGDRLRAAAPAAGDR